MQYSQVSATERRTMPPAIAVSAVAFAIEPPAGARIGDVDRDYDADRVSDADADQRAAAITPDNSDDANHSATANSGNDANAMSATRAGTTLWIPLVRRTREPFAGHWALPGGPTEWHETLTDTAMRTLTDAALRPPGYLEQLYAFGAVERSAKAQRLVTIAYWAQYGEHDLAAAPIHPSNRPINYQGEPPVTPRSSARWDDPRPVASGAATGLAAAATASPGATSTAAAPAEDPAPDPNVAWFSADRLPKLAFDHAEIVAYALWRLRIKTEYSSVAHRFLRQEFTLAQLRRVHEAILGQQVDPANFRRQLLASGDLIETGEHATGGAHRPAKLYRFRGDAPPPSPDRPHMTG